VVELKVSGETDFRCKATDPIKDRLQALQNLGQSGYPDGFSTDLITTPGLTWAAEVVASQLAQIGIEANILIMEEQAFQARLDKGQTELFLAETAANPLNPGELLGRLLLETGSENYTGYRNALFEDAFRGGATFEAEGIALYCGPAIEFGQTVFHCGRTIIPLLWSENSMKASATQPAPTAATTAAVIQGFAHQDLTVQAGTTVVWTNRDGVTHTATAQEGQWDSGILRERESFSFTFTEAGVFSYFCAIHPFMTAEVTVNN